METTNVTPIQNKVVQALEEIRDENQGLHVEIDRLYRENQMLRAQVQEVAAIAVRQALAIQDAIARTETDDAGT